jgi:hypothetical protein
MAHTDKRMYHNTVQNGIGKPRIGWILAHSPEPVNTIFSIFDNGNASSK